MFVEGEYRYSRELLGRNGQYERPDVPKAIEYTARLAPKIQNAEAAPLSN